MAAAQREARKAILAAALDAAAKIRDAQASFDSQLCEANRQVTEAEEVATDAMARADTGMEKIARLEAQLTDAILHQPSVGGGRALWPTPSTGQRRAHPGAVLQGGLVSSVSRR